MNKLIITDIDFKGKTVLVRVDFNVPLDKNQKITNDRRIVASLPTIKKIISDGGRAVLCSHLGRPKGQVVPEMSLKPVAERLSELLGLDVKFAPDCVGEETLKMSQSLKDGEVLLLENLRYHKEETDNDPSFAKELSKHGQLFVNDAFGTAHRAHASTEGVTKFIETCAGGYLMKKEIEYLDSALADPKRPFVAVLGGAKISGKIDVIENLLDKVDAILVGGGMIFTFFKAMGKNIGDSLLEENKIDLARETLLKAESKGVKFLLPVDCLAADEVSETAKVQIVSADNIPDGLIGLDIGPESIKQFCEILRDAKTVLWNGPMGVFEIEQFSKGTIEIAKQMAEITTQGTVTIVGGGDSAAAVSKAGLDGMMSHVSTGGGASLEFLEGKTLPGLAALSPAAVKV